MKTNKQRKQAIQNTEERLVISAENLAKVVYSLLREDLVAICKQENNTVRVEFPNGKEYLISVEELK